MENIIAMIKSLFKPKCVHSFKIKDVCNPAIDPPCIRCGKTLSECKKNKP